MRVVTLRAWFAVLDVFFFFLIMIATRAQLGKALGGATGGYTASSAAVVELLRQRARPYLFSNAIPPSTAAAGLKVFDVS